MWTLLNRSFAKRTFSHFLFVDGQGRVAIADHSIRNMKDPASTEDGLLVWDGQPIRLKDVHDPIGFAKTENGETVGVAVQTAVQMAVAAKKPVHEVIPQLFEGLK
jgi:hypothetical protein